MVDPAHDLLVDLAAHRLDLVVSAIRPTHHALLAVPLADEEFFLVGPPSMARTVDADRLRIAPADALAALPLVAYGEELPILRRYWRSEFGHRPTNPVALVAPDLRAVLAAVEAGAGISALPRYLAEPAPAAGRVIQLHCSEAPPLNNGREGSGFLRNEYCPRRRAGRGQHSGPMAKDPGSVCGNQMMLTP
ncbi:substrate-binding domain-containing protein [Streptomyces microflavus]|uniref:substrate-binding domain-containing protein n=1 Tax=Streptomyces microflavus TaxID=1919 RepID=UPI0036E3688B